LQATQILVGRSAFLGFFINEFCICTIKATITVL
jgi:hypothetical protein